MSDSQILFVFSGPSGSGKETVMRAVLDRLPRLSRIVTYTTRAPRPGELESGSYHFVSDAEFDRLRATGELFEAEAVYGSNRYGSPLQAVEGTDAGDLVMELDPKGFMRMRKARRAPTVGVFLLVPSAAELEKRISARAQEKDLARRLEVAHEQLGSAGAYDYVVVNATLSACVDDVAMLVQSERLRRDGRASLARVQREFDA